MAIKGKVEIPCYDAVSKVDKMTILCPCCWGEQSVQLKEAPAIKTVIVECSDCSKKEKATKK